MKTIKVSEAEGHALNWLVATAQEANVYISRDKTLDWMDVDRDHNGNCIKYNPAEDWAQGGPIIEREIIALDYDDATGWEARDFDSQQLTGYGPTPLIAAMRCFVALKLGDEVEIPDELA